MSKIIDGEGAGKTAKEFFKGLGLDKWLWAGLAVIAVIATLSIRHYVNKSFEERDNRIQELVAERDKAALERDNAATEKIAAEAKLRTEESKSKRAAEDARQAAEEKRALAALTEESDKRIAKLRKELEDSKFSVTDPDTNEETGDAVELSKRYNCYVLDGNSGQASNCF